MEWITDVKETENTVMNDMISAERKEKLKIIMARIIDEDSWRCRR